jgi:DNA integrity scanning protein DisA with diadenylate cyclase activity
MHRKIVATFKDICSGERGVNTQTLEDVIVLAIEIAREGREGRKIGTLFVVSDTEKTMRSSRCLILDPLLYHSDEIKNIKNPDLLLLKFGGIRSRADPESGIYKPFFKAKKQ